MFLAAVMAAGLAAASPSAGCETTATDAQRSGCLLREVEAADRQINATYAALRAKLDSAGRLDLRDAQRAWIRRRDQVCRLDNSQGDRAAWLASLARDYAKTVCVVRFTGARARELDARLAEPYAAPAPSPAKASESPSADVYELATPTPRVTGKWYFETAVDVGDLARASEQALFIGVRTDTQSTGTLLAIRKRDVARDAVNIGVAIDLDEGKLYIRENGVWRGGGPGSSGGQDLKLGRAYRGWVSSSAALGRALEARALAANFGQTAFAYSLPDGYRPMDARAPVMISGR